MKNITMGGATITVWQAENFWIKEPASQIGEKYTISNIEQITKKNVFDFTNVVIVPVDMGEKLKKKIIPFIPQKVDLKIFNW